jgi:hypothetical protein
LRIFGSGTSRTSIFFGATQHVAFIRRVLSYRLSDVSHRSSAVSVRCEPMTDNRSL